ncbi:hypothetical protein QBC46DRAFT_377230 [Diplogelasinospora grovesii]|uniref:Secreted protein n=1 Tax=Diplogelasinospora grovesii TaxID=303347 RepID=A0AAN6S7N0_9PEZI|nr:hypothetical protein QBC46DRAFT_377230 [Diplogelasinospora grovesii]
MFVFVLFYYVFIVPSASSETRSATCSKRRPEAISIMYAFLHMSPLRRSTGSSVAAPEVPTRLCRTLTALSCMCRRILAIWC